MRSMLMMMAVLALILVFVIVFAVFSTNMQSVLGRTEVLHMEELSETLMAAMRRVEENLQTNALAIASWDDTRNFVLNKNSRYLVGNMTDYSMLKDYGYNYVIIKDLIGRDMYSMGYDFNRGVGSVLPLGFTRKLTEISNLALHRYAEDAGVRVTDDKYAGLMIYDGKAYLLCTLPITDNLRATAPVGTLTFALDFTQEFAREFTGLPKLELEIRPADDDDADANHTIHARDALYLSIIERMPDILGNPLVITMTHPREIFREGTRLVLMTSLVLMGLLMLALALMFIMIDRFIIGPTKALATDVMSVSAESPLDLTKFTKTTELSVLSRSIHSMIDRLEHNQRIAARDKMSISTLQSILNSMDAYLYVSDPDTSEILFINDKMKDHFGIVGEPVGQICWRVLQSGITDECEFCPVKRLREDPTTTIYWEEHNTVTGRYYRNTDKMISWTDDKRVHLQHSVDVTDIKKAEDQLIRLSGMIESAPQFVSFISDNDECEYFNPAAETITGYTVEELLQGGFPLLFSEEDVQIIHSDIVPGIHSSGRRDFELYMRRKDGQIRLMQFCGFELNGQDGGACTIAVDITDTRQMELDLIEAKEIAEQTSQAKSEFLSRMSHEMRTPMNAIIGMTNIAKMSPSWERREYCLSKIEGASKHLLGVINDILDMSKIEANKFELSSIDFSFEKVLESVINVINFRMEEKHQHMVLSVDNKIPPVLFGDEQRLAQVLTNLLTNANKFTPDGGQIALYAHLVKTAGKQITMQIDISDTGIGISEAQKARLFQSFEQADGGISRRFGGTGLGLAISKRIVELMGGRIWVESVEGQGSTFSFTAEFGISDAQMTDEDGKLKRTGLHILAVDDSEDALEYARHVMGQLGETCDIAVDGEEALRLIQEAEQPYDVVFVDFQMPGMDGIELTREIRKLQAQHPVIIMVSVAEWSEISSDALKAGVSSFIPKPLFPSQVAQCINNMLTLGGDKTGSAPQEDPLRFAGLCVMLVEDVEINREIVTSMLSYTEIQFVEAENGERAVELFSEDPQRYDMILMDIQMPIMDGLEATRRIRALPDRWAKRIPIIAMTANAFREDMERCLEAGMDAHVAKPLDMPQLMSEMDKHLVRDADKS